VKSYLLGVGSIGGVWVLLLTFAFWNPGGILSDPAKLSVNWTGYDGPIEEYYFYEAGKWVKKEKPVLWWKYAELKNVKVHFPDSKPGYGSVVGVGVAMRESDIPTYGGSFIDADRGVVFVYVGNEEDGRKVLEKVNGSVKLVLLKGKYSYAQLRDWKYALTEKVSKSGLPWTGTAVDDTMNRVFIGFESIEASLLKKLESILEELGIPFDAVVVQKQGRVVLSTRSDYIRPLIGGIQIQNPNAGLCTLGFIAERSGTKGFVTAGHCGNINDPIYQPEFLGSDQPTANIAGNVEADPSGARFSDSMWVVLATNAAYKIYNEWNPSISYVVFSEMQSQTPGMYVCKGGITTGETCGQIALVGEDVPHPEYNTLYDQVKATYSSDQGDSGAPVYYDPLDTWIRNWCFETYGVACKDIYGIHWGLMDGYSVYSPISGIENDLGELRTS